MTIHSELARWAREEEWGDLRPFQKESEKLIFGSNCDFIISASTSAGKTEAALLPLLTIAANRRSGVSVLCLSPTKALINDQLRRLMVPASRVGVPIFAWHGDVPVSLKRKLMKVRRGVVTMTIESLEGWMIRHPRIVEELFADLDAIIIDEFHEFLDSERGAQLNCLLARLDELTRTTARRIALSATIADPDLARRWLRLQDPSAVRLVKGPDDLKPVRSKIRGHIGQALSRPSSIRDQFRNYVPVALREIEMSIFQRLRSGTHIVFANSRANVEALADALARRCERAQVHNPFVPHHGSIAKHTREDVERRLRSGEQLTALTTTTLGLGLDIGSVKSVEIIGAPLSMTALRQYIGRSGRRDAPAAVSLHITEVPHESAVKLADQLRLSTARACAALNLLEQRFFEPPEDDGTTLSVVFQEVLSIIKQRRGALFSQILNLIQSVTAFGIVTEKMLREMLAHLVADENPFVEQAADGRYILTQKGEKLVLGPKFYASFRTTDQWEIVAQDKRKVGSFSLSNALTVGETFCLAGERWEVTGVDLRHCHAVVIPSLKGGVPIFDPMGRTTVHERIAQEMLRVLKSEDVPADLDHVAATHLNEGRAAFRRFELGSRALVRNGDVCHVFSWKGTRFNRLLVEVLRANGFVCSADEVGVTIASNDVHAIIEALANDRPTLDELSSNVGGILNGKYDRHIPDHLLRQYWAKRHERKEPAFHEFCRTCLAQRKGFASP